MRSWILRLTPRALVILVTAYLLAAAPGLNAQTKKQIEDQRLELLRGLSSEYATARTLVPRSKKALEFDADTGYWNKDGWAEIGKDDGPAARSGDLVQITKVAIEKNDIILELNNGYNGARGHWYDRVNVNGGGPITDTAAPAPGGTSILVRYAGGMAGVTSEDVKKALLPILDFNQRSSVESYVDKLPPEIKAAIHDKKAIVGMDRDQLLLAMGQPVRKSRENVDGDDLEDWIYGNPPGKVTFVTLKRSKVVKVMEDFANLGGSVADTPHTP